MLVFFFLMLRRPPRPTQGRSSAASDVYKRQPFHSRFLHGQIDSLPIDNEPAKGFDLFIENTVLAVPYTHLRAHETVLDLVCRLLLEKKKESYMEAPPRSSSAVSATDLSDDL